MKRVLILVLLALSLPAYASEDWTIVGEQSEGGNRILADQSTFRKTRDSQHMYVEGVFKLEGDETALTVRIGVLECLDKAKGTLSLLGPNAPQQLFWTSDGSRSYDQMGKTLCEFLKNNTPKIVPKKSALEEALETPKEPEHWMPIAEDTEGTRFVVDSNTMYIDRAASGENWISVKAQILPGDRRVSVKVDFDQCKESDQGRLILNYGNDQSSYFYDGRSSRIYDQVGHALCQAAISLEIAQAKSRNANSQNDKKSDSHAEAWQPIASDSKSGIIIYGQAHSSTVYTDSHDDTHWADITIRVGESGEIDVATVNVDECKNGHKGTLFIMQRASGHVSKGKWSADGTTLFDYVGQTACGAGLAAAQ